MIHCNDPRSVNYFLRILIDFNNWRTVLSKPPNLLENPRNNWEFPITNGWNNAGSAPDTGLTLPCKESESDRFHLRKQIQSKSSQTSIGKRGRTIFCDYLKRMVKLPKSRNVDAERKCFSVSLVTYSDLKGISSHCHEKKKEVVVDKPSADVFLETIHLYPENRNQTPVNFTRSWKNKARISKEISVDFQCVFFSSAGFFSTGTEKFVSVTRYRFGIDSFRVWRSADGWTLRSRDSGWS